MSGRGATVRLDALVAANDGRLDRALFGEAASRVVVAVRLEDGERLATLAREHAVPLHSLGMAGGDALAIEGLLEAPITELRAAWEDGLTSAEYGVRDAE